MKKYEKNNDEKKIKREIEKQDEFSKALAKFENELKSVQNNPPKTVEQIEVIL